MNCECKIIKELQRENIRLIDDYNRLLKATACMQEEFRVLYNAKGQLSDDKMASLKITAYCPDFTKEKPKEL